MLFIIFIILSYTRYARRYGLTDQTAKRRFFSAVSALVITIAVSYAGAFATGVLITIAAAEFSALTGIYHVLQNDSVESLILSTIIAAPTTILATIYVPKFVVLYSTRHLRNKPIETPLHRPAPPPEAQPARPPIVPPRPAAQPPDRPARQTKFPTAIVAVAISFTITGAAISAAIFMITGSNEIQPAQPLVQIITPIPRPTSTPTKAPLPTDTPVPPTSTPQPTFTPKPTYPPATRHVYQPSPTPPDPTAEIIAAFASCGGQYQGQAAAEREKAARSTLELGYHTPQELADIIVQNCLAIAQVAPEPTATPQPTPTRQPTRTLIAPTPQPTQAHASLSATLATPFPTRSHISDLIAPSRKHKTDFHQFQNARWLNHNNPALANEIKIVSWIQDGLDSIEAEILEYLLYMVTSEKHHHQISSIVQMPFLKTPEPADISALNSLNRIVHDDPQHLDAILTHPTVANGITDAWTPIIATLQSAARAQPHLIAQLLDPNQVTIESRHIELPLAGEVQIDIIRTRNTASNALDLADHAIKASEAFMITPFPNNHVAILFAETVPHGNAGANFNSHIAIGSEYDVDDGSHEARYLPHIIAHEIAHHYWADNADWIDEGISDFITSISEYTRIGTPIEATNEPCPLYDTIKDLERSRQQRGTAAFHCNYALGERLFVELHAAFGDVPFRQHLKTLYLRSEDNDFRNLLGIATTSKDVAEIFGDTDAGTTVLNRWINGTEPYDASRIDTTPPTNTIPSINGRIQSASLVLNKTDSPINSFSAQNPVQPQIRFKYTHNVAGGPHLRPIRIIEFYEDGHQTSNRTIQVEADQRSNGNTWTWHIPVGPHNQPWKPGQYWAMFYDGDLKIAEVQWLVTP